MDLRPGLDTPAAGQIQPVQRSQLRLVRRVSGGWCRSWRNNRKLAIAGGWPLCVARLFNVKKSSAIRSRNHASVPKLAYCKTTTLLWRHHPASRIAGPDLSMPVPPASCLPSLFVARSHARLIALLPGENVMRTRRDGGAEFGHQRTWRLSLRGGLDGPSFCFAIFRGLRSCSTPFHPSSGRRSALFLTHRRREPPDPRILEAELGVTLFTRTSRVSP